VSLPDSTKHTRYAPIVIVGAGVVGATTALLLAQHLPKLQILLIDAGTHKPVNPSQHDSRVFALSSASIHLLTQTGVWPHISRRADYTGMQVWSQNGAGELCFGTVQDNQPADILGSMVEPSVLASGLHTQMAQCPNIHLLSETTVTALDDIAHSFLSNHCVAKDFTANNTAGKSVESEAESTADEQTTAHHATARPKPLWQLTLSSGQHILTPLVIAADGRHSFIRREAGIGVDTLDYKKTAIACAIHTQQPHGQTARQIFLPTGPLALLPLADIATDVSEQGCWQSIVWTLPTNQALDSLAQEQQHSGYLATQIAAKSQYALGEVYQAKHIASFPLTALHADSYVKQGLALVGDAAHGVHPLAGQGLNMGLLDVAVLTDRLITEWQRSRGSAFVSLPQLMSYEQARRGHNAAMMHSFSLIGWVFGEQNYPAGHLVEWLRSEAVQVSSRLPLLNEWFGHQASGMAALAKTRWHA